MKMLLAFVIGTLVFPAAYVLVSTMRRDSFSPYLVSAYSILSGKNASPVQTPFVDISGNPNESAIATLYGLGITRGVDSTHFAPTAKVGTLYLSTFIGNLAVAVGKS